jgi:hypothetical protein
MPRRLVRLIIVRVAEENMKFFMIVSVFLFLYFQNSPAQVIKNYGLLAGFSSANQEYIGIPPESFDLKPRGGILIGIFSEFFNTSNYSLLTQIEYTQRGTSFDGVTTDPVGNSFNETYYSRMDYLSFPISGKFFLKELRYSPYLIAGLRYDYLLGFESFSLEPVYDNFKKSIFGAQFGIGLEFIKLIVLDFALEIRYNLDFTNSLNLDGKSAKNKAIDFTFFMNLN